VNLSRQQINIIMASATASNIGTDISSVSKRGRKRRGDANIDDIRDDVEDENKEKIWSYLKGNLDMQTMILKMLERGSLVKKQKKVLLEKMIASSTNKYNLFSVENWADVLSGLDPDHFERDTLMLCSKSFLVKTGCYVGLLDPGSAPPSRKISLIVAHLKCRERDFGKGRYKDIRIEANEEKDGITKQHNFDEDGGCYKIVKESDGVGKIVHVGSGLEVRLDDKDLLDAKVSKNHSDNEACIKGKYSDPIIRRIFELGGVHLPKLFWLKKITDVGEELLEVVTDAAVAPSASSASASSGLTLAAIKAHNVSHAVPPEGSGDSVMPHGGEA
jgi:hypothetical protein